MSQKELTMPSVETILAEVPFELRSTLKSMADDTRFAIILMLLKNGEMSFSQLREVLALPSNVLSHHLKALTQAALVRNYYAKKSHSEGYSFYDTTAIARDFVDKVLSAMMPRAPVVDVLASLLKADQTYSAALTDLASSIQEYGSEATMNSVSVARLRMFQLNIASR